MKAGEGPPAPEDEEEEGLMPWGPGSSACLAPAPFWQEALAKREKMRLRDERIVREKKELEEDDEGVIEEIEKMVKERDKKRTMMAAADSEGAAGAGAAPKLALEDADASRIEEMGDDAGGAACFEGGA